MGFCNSKQRGQHDPSATARYRTVRVMSIPAVPGEFTRRNTDLSLASTKAGTRGTSQAEYLPLTAATSTVIDHSDVSFREGFQHINTQEEEDQAEEEEERNRFSSERMKRLLAHRRFSESRMLEQKFQAAAAAATSAHKDTGGGPSGGRLRHIDSKAEFAHRSSSFILETQDFDNLNKYIPSLLHRKWKLLYSSQLDGYSFATMLAKCENRGPLVFILQQETTAREVGKAKKKNIFGFYVSPYLKRWDEFTGDDSCFMFRIVKKLSKKHRSSKVSTLLEYSHNDNDDDDDTNNDEEEESYEEGTLPQTRNIYHVTHNNSNYLYCNDKKKRHKDYYIGLALGGTATREDSFQLVLTPDLSAGYCSMGIDGTETKASCTYRAPLLVTRPKGSEKESSSNSTMVPFKVEKLEVYGFEYGSSAQLLINSPAMDEMIKTTPTDTKSNTKSSTAGEIIGQEQHETPDVIEATGSHDEIKDPPRRRMSIADASSGAFVYKMFHNE